ncbi:MAG: hypothetical protein AB1714_09695 [Acidobacteriota bacterium]
MPVFPTAPGLFLLAPVALTLRASGWRAPDAVLIVGHRHVPFALHAMGEGLIVNPGSVLRDVPRWESVYSSATFGVLELPSKRFTVHRIAGGAEMDILRITAGVRDMRSFRD